MRKHIIACWFALAILSLTVRAYADAPDWMREAAAAKAPTYGEKVPAVVLLSEQRIRIEKDGRITTTTRYVVRILAREGRGYARGSAIYLPDTGKVREMRAWLIRSSGEVKQYEKDRVLDLAVGGLEEYNEVRRKLIVAEGDADAGAVFGYEAVTEDRSVFTQFEWQFQGRLPALTSRFELTLPEGWRAESITFNRARIEPAMTGSTHTWELRHLPEIEREPAGPEVTNLAPRLAVSVFPAKGGIGRSFDNWRDVSRWLSELSDPQATPNEQLAAKARELTAGAGTELERIRKIGRYAQSIKYVSIQTGIGRGGGYRPHPAIEVLTKGYGDCKDKANLMRTMLVSLGITAHLVSIYSGDPTYVREEWASPQQFNHCIVAVKVSDGTNAAATIEHPQLGRLLIFDPTDEDTPVGDLPDEQQGSLALVVAGEAGALLRMPTLPAEASHLDRQVEATLQSDGSLTTRLREQSTGQAAVEERRSVRLLSGSGYKQMIERWITSGATAASVSRIEPADEKAEGRFKLEIEFTVPSYAQPTGKLLLFRPAIVSRREQVFLTEKTRRRPIVLDADSEVETTRIRLPDRFVVDELPDPVEIRLLDPAQPGTPFGVYAATYKAIDGQLLYTRRLHLRKATLPVEQYEEVKKFFERIREAELSRVVLVLK